jgi:hypothetical protein
VSAFDKVQQAAKAFAGGLAGAIVSVLFTTVTDPDAAVNPDAAAGANAVVQLPNTQAEWVTLLVSIVVGFVLPYIKRNFPSVLQAQKQLAIAEARVVEGKQTQ